MTFRLNNSDPRLDANCREVESRIGSNDQVTDHQWVVELLQSFSDLAESASSSKFASTPAFYRISTNTIYVNTSVFFGYSHNHQLAILVHEVAHALRAQPEFGAIKEELGLHECTWADWHTCQWGCSAELIDERAASSGQTYASALSLWPNRDRFAAAMAKYRMQHAAGIV